MALAEMNHCLMRHSLAPLQEVLGGKTKLASRGRWGPAGTVVMRNTWRNETGVAGTFGPPGGITRNFDVARLAQDSERCEFLIDVLGSVARRSLSAAAAERANIRALARLRRIS